MLLRIAPARYLSAKEDIVRQGCLKLRPFFPREVLAGDKENVRQQGLHRQIVAGDGHMDEEAPYRRAVRRLFRQALDFLPTFFNDYVAAGVGELQRNRRLVKVQQQRSFPRGSCLLA